MLVASLNTVSMGQGQKQEIAAPIEITLRVKNKSLEMVFTEISAKSGLNFHYDKAELNLKKKVTLSCFKASIDEVLAMLSAQTGLQFTRASNKIVVGTTDKAGSSPALNPADQVSPEIEISGTVHDSKGNQLPGVTVLIQYTNKGTQTNAEAGFRIKARSGDTLVFSSIGFITYEIPVSTGNSLQVVLNENIKALNELVVTALGLPKKARELPYSTQQLGGDELNLAKDANFINALSGKTAGLLISRNASGIAGSVRVVMRGNKSTRENQPLYIVDGVPFANYTPAQPADVWGQANNISFTGGRDGGDGISNLNADDIESISILKGASAAALYGSQAANGVILITTKKGKAGKIKVDFSSDLTMEKPMLLPQLQFRYGQTTPPYSDGMGKSYPGSLGSWGNPILARDHVQHYFKTGNTAFNTISLSGGSKIAQTYFSYGNTNNTGILPTSRFNRHTVNIRQTLKLLNNKLQIDASISILTQKSNNRFSSGLYYSPISGVYLFPRGQDFNDYKNNFEYFDPVRNLHLQRWWNIRNDKDWIGQDDQQNPEWALRRNLRVDTRYRNMATLAFNWQLNSWLSLKNRSSFDQSLDQYELQAYAGTQVVLAGANGRYTLEKEYNTQLYSDLMANVNGKISHWLHLAGNLGASITHIKAHERTYNGTNPNAEPGLIAPNQFSVSNISPSSRDAQYSVDRKQLQALFSNVQMGINNNIFLELTVRNDWSSTFAFTPTAGKGYLYYSTGLSIIWSDLFKLPKRLNYLRSRISYARVGNDIASYSSKPSDFIRQQVAGVPRVVLNQRTPYPGIYLQPEDNRSLEAGIEMRWFNNRLNADITFYKNNNYNQYMEVPAPRGTGYDIYYLNLGNIQNQGWEVTIAAIPIRKNTFNWATTINFATNKNKIISLSNAATAGTNLFVLTDFGVNMFGSFIQEGGSWGDIYANKELLTNNKGQYIIDAQGRPKVQAMTKKVGNPNPDFTLGWNNSFDYRHFNLSFLIDGRFGGKVMSVTQAVLDWYGVSETTARARDKGGVVLNAVNEDGSSFPGKMDAQAYYTGAGSRAGIGEMYMYNATNIRLRELSLSYRIPLKWKWLKNMRVGIIGRNLFFFQLHAPFDPELSMGSGNGLQGVDVFGLPQVRSMGINLRLGL
jgi:TonB-linked SusC/RagA family outer membrane protein